MSKPKSSGKTGQWQDLSTQHKGKGQAPTQAIITVAGPGRGKSTLLRDDVEHYIRSMSDRISPPMGPRALIHDPSEASSFADIWTIEQFVHAYERASGRCLNLQHPLDLLKTPDPYNKQLPLWKSGMLKYNHGLLTEEEDIEMLHKYSFKYLKDTFCLFDECQGYYTSNPPGWARNTVLKRRNAGNHVQLVFHQVLAIPICLTRSDMVTTIRLFYTRENLNYNQLARFSCQADIWDAWQELKHYEDTDLRTQPYAEIVIGKAGFTIKNGGKRK